MNFTLKSGGQKPHGQVSDFVRNTIFDAWSFQAKAATTKNAAGATVPAPKPVEHQNELSASFGWKVPHTADKVFFFAAYDKFHSRRGAAYALYTIPTTLMRTGDFTELGTSAFLYDPTTTTCAGSTCTRQPFMGTKNGDAVVPAGADELQHYKQLSGRPAERLRQPRCELSSGLRCKFQTAHLHHWSAGHGQLCQQFLRSVPASALHRRRSGQHLPQGLRHRRHLHHQFEHDEPVQVRVHPFLPEHPPDRTGECPDPRGAP